MRYIAILKVDNEDMRFFNSLTDEDLQESGVQTEMLKFVSEHRGQGYRSLGLVNDGLIPMMFNSRVPIKEIECSDTKSRGDELVATLLMATGFCEKRLKIHCDSEELEIVRERSENLLKESRKHFALLSKFKKMEQQRAHLFNTTASLMSEWVELSKSAIRLDEISRNLQLAIGEKPDLV